MSDDLNFSFNVDDILSLIFYMPSDEELAHYMPIAGKSFTPTVVSELPATGDESDLYLVPKSYTSQTASGNPITVNITDNAGKIESLKLDGDTLQDGEPTPDNPVTIQTVTGEQTVEIVGKNLLDIGGYIKASDDGLTYSYDNTSGIVSVSGTPSPNTYAHLTDKYKRFLPAGTYTFSITQAISHRVYLWVQYTDGAQASVFVINAGNTSITSSFPKDVEQIRVDFSAITTGTAISESFGAQLEYGSTASSFAPYSKQTLPLDLGTIELCKLGDYQDYIYKDGEDWKVHKNIASTRLTSSYDWFTDHVSDQNRLYINSENLAGAGVRPSSNMQIGQILSTHFSPISITNLLAGGGGIGISQTGFISIRDNEQTTANGFKDWLDNNNIYAYYALATSTDTTITDQTLITQLEAIAKAALQSGSNTISNTASGTNLAGDLDISYHGYDPLNKYNKYIWINLDGAYEQL